jgi:hypothetical protein
MRQEKRITIEDRGNKLEFVIREMSATQLEDWTMRACLVLAGAGSDIPASGGVEGIGKYLAEHGLAAVGNVNYEKAKPLLDEMLGCCYRVVDKMEEKVTPETADAYIMDVSTLFKLRLEAFKVNFSFFGSGGQSASPEKQSTVRLSAR